MKAATVSQLKKELKTRDINELLEITLRLSKFKKENKELLTYLLYEVSNESAFIDSIKEEVKIQFQEINKGSYYYINKSIRKILRNVKKHIRYSQKKETEIELILFFCIQMKNIHPPITKHIALRNLYNRQVESIKKTLTGLHEDLQYDYEVEIEKL